MQYFQKKYWYLPMIVETLPIHETSIMRSISDYQNEEKLTLERSLSVKISAKHIRT